MRKTFLMPKNFRRATGGAAYIIAQKVGDRTEYSQGYEVYTPGTTHPVSDHRWGISQASYDALRVDARSNSRLFKASTHTAQDALATQKPRPMQRETRIPVVTGSVNSLVERAV